MKNIRLLQGKLFTKLFSFYIFYAYKVQSIKSRKWKLKFAVPKICIIYNRYAFDIYNRYAFGIANERERKETDKKSGAFCRIHAHCATVLLFGVIMCFKFINIYSPV